MEKYITRFAFGLQGLGVLVTIVGGLGGLLYAIFANVEAVPIVFPLVGLGFLLACLGMAVLIMQYVVFKLCN